MTHNKAPESKFQPSKLLLAAVLLAAACGQSSADATSSDGLTAGAHKHKRVCSDAAPGEARCHAWVRVNDSGAIQPFATPSGLTPANLKSAYNLPSTGGTGMTIGIVDAYDAVNAEADLAVYRAQFGLPPCTTANGCFRKVGQTGTSTLPAANASWAEETSLDLDMASAICPNCKILLVEATSATTANLGKSVNTAVSLGANVVSNSYGGSESSSDPSTTTSYYNHPGVLITASSGDSGYGVEYPAASTSVLAVGGTSLTTASNARGWTETVWGSAANTNGGAGSGCSTVETKPSWQHDTGCAKRTVADVSAIADPQTGVAVYDSASGGWLVFGGTSVASPVVASIFALTGHAAATPQYPYSNPSFFYDVTSGTNGSCSGSYLCTAVVGYDGPTGIGTPNGTLMAGGTTTPPTNDFSVSASPATLSIAAGASGSSTISTATTAGTAQTVALSVSGGATGVTAALSPASVTSGGSSTLTVTTTSAAAAGTVTFTITGSATSGSHSATVTVTVTSSGGGGGTCKTQTQLLGNAGFESGNTIWTASAGVIDNSTSPAAHTGSFKAWLDGYGSTHTDTLTQTVTIPAGACTATLSFWLLITTQETTTTTAYDKLVVSVGGTTVATYSNLNKGTAYAQKSIDLASYKGKTVTLSFKGTEDNSLATNFLVDDTAITITQ